MNPLISPKIYERTNESYVEVGTDIAPSPLTIELLNSIFPNPLPHDRIEQTFSDPRTIQFRKISPPSLCSALEQLQLTDTQIQFNFHEACYKGNTLAIQVLLQAGVTVHTTESAALGLAAAYDNLDIVRLLLQHGATLKNLPKRGSRHVLAACRLNMLQVVITKELLTCDYDVLSKLIGSESGRQLLSTHFLELFLIDFLCNEKHENRAVAETLFLHLTLFPDGKEIARKAVTAAINMKVALDDEALTRMCILFPDLDNIPETNINKAHQLLKFRDAVQNNDTQQYKEQRSAINNTAIEICSLLLGTMAMDEFSSWMQKYYTLLNENNHNHSATELYRVFAGVTWLNKSACPVLSDQENYRMTLFAQKKLNTITTSFHQFSRNETGLPRDCIVDVRMHALVILDKSKNSLFFEEGSYKKVTNAILLLFPRSIKDVANGEVVKRATHKNKYYRPGHSQEYVLQTLCNNDVYLYLLYINKHGITKLNAIVKSYDCDLYALTCQKRLSPTDIYSIFLGTIKSLYILHTNNYAHYDIKIKNVFIYDQRYAVLSDFGIAKKDPSSRRTKRFQRWYYYGAAFNSAPEILSGRIKTHTLESGQREDMYAFGWLLYHLLHKEPNWLCTLDNEINSKEPLNVEIIQTFEANQIELHQALQSSDRAEDHMTAEMNTLLVRLLDPNPVTRITIEELHKAWIAINPDLALEILQVNPHCGMSEHHS